MILATRGSRLAVAQAELVRDRLLETGVEAELLIVHTKGDADRKRPLSVIGGNGLFIRELEEAVLSGAADAAVHSAKDLPYELAAGLEIAALADEADPRDMIVWCKRKEEDILSPAKIFDPGKAYGSESGCASEAEFAGVSDRKLLEHKTIGTGSSRRISECVRLYGLKNSGNFKNIRGNIDTRIKKLESGEYDALILAKAGIDRLGVDMSRFGVRIFSTEEMIPAPCQGMIAAECRIDDEETKAALARINIDRAKKRFDIERSIFRCLGADCSKAVGIHAILNADQLYIAAMLEGKRAAANGLYKDRDSMCESILEQLLSDK